MDALSYPGIDEMNHTLEVSVFLNWLHRRNLNDYIELDADLLRQLKFSEVHILVFEAASKLCAGTFVVQGIVKEEACS